MTHDPKPGETRANKVITCNECDRQFDMADDDQRGDWYYGHDCENPDEKLAEAVMVERTWELIE